MKQLKREYKLLKQIQHVRGCDGQTCDEMTLT